MKFNLLRDQEIEQLIELLPSRKHSPIEPDTRTEIREQIEEIRAEAFALIQADVNSWGTKPARRQDLKDLNALRDLSTSLLEVLPNLSPRIRLRLGEDPNRSGLLASIPQIGASQPTESAPLGTPELEQVAWTIIVLRDKAIREIGAIEESLKPGSGPTGRPIAFVERKIAFDLGLLWQQFGGNPSKSTRFDTKTTDYTESWPFLEFVNAVGRSVDPKFNGRAACNDVVAAHRKSEKLTSILETQPSSQPGEGESPDSAAQANEAISIALDVCTESADEIRSAGLTLDALAVGSGVAKPSRQP